MRRRADTRRRSRRGAALLVTSGAVLLAVGSAALLSHGSPKHGQASEPPAGSAPPSPAAPIGPPGQAAPATEQFGTSVNRLFNDRSMQQSQIDAQLGALRRTGATLARSDALWEATEPQAPVNRVHHYDWSFDDSIAGSLASHGLRWLPIIDYTAPWAQSIPGQEHSPPRAASDYASYAAAFAARYGRGGTFWSTHPTLEALPVDAYEVWNEPDSSGFWVPAPDASRYVDLYVRARDAIKLVDPTARVIVGGLTSPGKSLRAMVAARPDLAGHIDGVAIHPYGVNPAAVLYGVSSDRGELNSLGLASTPLYVTEFGWTTLPAGALDWAPARARPAYISRTVAALGHLNCGVAAALLYTWVTPERDPGNSEDWFGIHSPEGVDSADTDAFAAGLRKAVMPGPTIPLCAAR